MDSVDKKYDPKLKDCAEEIKSILRKYDVMGTVSLVSPTHGEFVMEFPSWSGVQFEGSNLRVKIRKGDQVKAEATAHMVVSIMQVNEMFIRNFETVFGELTKHSLISFSSLDERITPDNNS